MRKKLLLLISLFILPVSANDFNEVAKVAAFYSEDNKFIYAITRNQT